MQRRSFLLGGLAALTAGPRVLHAKADPAPHLLSLHHTHTDEALELPYRLGQRLAPRTLRSLNHFLRDFRTEESVTIDRQLLDILTELKRRARNPDGVIEIISAYRSPKTNAMLRRKSSGVARRSLHMEGKALDVRLRGTSTSRLRDLAIDLRRGGVGYYRRSNFVHLDTGRVRHW
jgi:uncharacterized protein YcbK (DUF882 family)